MLESKLARVGASAKNTKDKMIKPGEIAIIKTTEEPVAVIFQDDQHWAGRVPADWKSYRVRRPMGGKDGVTHNLETFYDWELKSLDDVKAEQKAAEDEFRAKLEKVHQGAQGTLPFSGSETPKYN